MTPMSHKRCAVLMRLALASPLLLAGCGSGEGGEAEAAVTTAGTTAGTTAATDEARTTATPSTTTAPTTPASTTSSTTTTPKTTTTTTSTSSTTSTTLPQPIAPPSDPDAAEPVIELGRIAIPAIGVDMAMYEGIRLTTLDYGPGHWPGSAMPGEPGNMVVGGHRTSKHKVFRNIDDLVAGDQIVFTDPDGTQHVYIVNRIEVVEPDAMWIVDPTETPTTTLFACHPPGSTRQRIVVFADLRA
jgi:sortase A